MLYYIKAKNIRDCVKGHNKRVSKEFLEALDRYVHSKILQAVKEHNGGKKTLDSAIAGYILGMK
jgi:hypothetical protein